MKLFALAALVALGTASQAAVWTLSTMMTGGQEVPPNSSTASGMFTGTYNDVTNTLTVTMFHFDQFASPLTAAHVHRGATGSNGGVFVNFNAPTNFSLAGGMWSYVGPSTFTGISEADEANIIAGNSYINVHSQQFPGGEIRGQIQAVPEPATIAALGLGLIALRKRRKA